MADIQTRASALYDEGCRVVAEETKLRKSSGKNILRLASILRDLYDVYQRKPVELEPVLGPERKKFPTFRDAMMALLRPLQDVEAGMSERSGYYYLSIGRHLLGKVPAKQLESLGFARIRELARVATAKGDVPQKLLKEAPDLSASELRSKVTLLLYKGHEEHDGGPRKAFTIVAPEDQIDQIRSLIEDLRPRCSEAGQKAGATDATVIEYALVEYKNQASTEDEHREKKELRAPAETADWPELEEG